MTSTKQVERSENSKAQNAGTSFSRLLNKDKYSSGMPNSSFEVMASSVCGTRLSGVLEHLGATPQFSRSWTYCSFATSAATFVACGIHWRRPACPAVPRASRCAAERLPWRLTPRGNCGSEMPAATTALLQSACVVQGDCCDRVPTGAVFNGPQDVADPMGDSISSQASAVLAEARWVGAVQPRGKKCIT